MRWGTWVSYTRSNAKRRICPRKNDNDSPQMPGQTDCRQLHAWLMQPAAKVPNNSATAKAIDIYCHDQRWAALNTLPVRRADPDRQQFAGSRTRSGRCDRHFEELAVCRQPTRRQRAAAIMSLIQSGQTQWSRSAWYLEKMSDAILPTQRASRIGELLPHRWRAEAAFT